MDILNSASEAFLKAYLDNASPTGFETAGQKLWLDYIRPYVDSCHIDNYGTVYGVVNPNNDYRVVIEAHADEISWFVHYISDDGYLYVVRNGGSDHQIAPAKRVLIHTSSGVVAGVFGWPAIHTRSAGKDPETNLENLFIDVGASSRQQVLDMGVHVGCVVTYPDPMIVLNDTYYCGRALDNRIGGFCIAQVARLLRENSVKLPFALYIVNSVQEEVGLRGAEMITQTIKPHAVIVTDVTHDTSTPLMGAKKLGDVKCGNGPSITYAPSVHNKLRELVLQAALEHNIAVQREAASRFTGTDTDAFAFSNGGVPSVLISLPLRYMHTTVEMAHKRDVNDVIRLIYHSLQRIEYRHDFRYFSV